MKTEYLNEELEKAPGKAKTILNKVVKKYGINKISFEWHAEDKIGFLSIIGKGDFMFDGSGNIYKQVKSNNI